MTLELFCSSAHLLELKCFRNYNITILYNKHITANLLQEVSSGKLYHFFVNGLYIVFVVVEQQLHQDDFISCFFFKMNVLYLDFIDSQQHNLNFFTTSTFWQLQQVLITNNPELNICRELFPVLYF